jgi:hypothetical protein
VAPASTRFSINGAPILSQPQGEFRRNVGHGFGADGAVVYHIDRPGYFSVRFDVSGVQYGSETREAPLSPTIGGRILVDVTTRNSITAFSVGPELAWPRGPLRPYFSTGFSELLFRTTSSVVGTESSEAFASTTNYKDWTAAWFWAGGVRIPLAGNDPRKAISMDLGVRYHHGGIASYLREGSIQDLPGGSISITPLSSRTPHLVYMIGIRFRIPHNSANPCPRLVC